MALVAVLVFFMTGCAAMERLSMRPTEPYYLSNTQEQFPPKPREFQVPMLSQSPQQSRPIGIFQFTTRNGRSFAIRAAAYNARRVGADAVWMRNVQEWSEPYAYDIPAHWETKYETVYRKRHVTTKGQPGQPDVVREETYPETIERHIFVPTEHVSGFHHFTSIDAVMYRQR